MAAGFMLGDGSSTLWTRILLVVADVLAPGQAPSSRFTALPTSNDATAARAGRFRVSREPPSLPFSKLLHPSALAAYHHPMKKHKAIYTLVAASLATTALTFAATAAADNGEPGGGDSQFVSIIHEHIMGLTADGGDPALEKLGHAVCSQLDSDYGDRGTAQQKLANKWSSESDAEWFITASAVAYCPEYIKSSDRW